MNAALTTTLSWRPIYALNAEPSIVHLCGKTSPRTISVSTRLRSENLCTLKMIVPSLPANFVVLRTRRPFPIRRMLRDLLLSTYATRRKVTRRQSDQQTLGKHNNAFDRNNHMFDKNASILLSLSLSFSLYIYIYIYMYTPIYIYIRILKTR